MSRVWDLREQLEEHQHLTRVATDCCFYPANGLPSDVAWDNPGAVKGWVQLRPTEQALAVQGRDGLWFCLWSRGHWYVAMAPWERLRPR